MPAALVRGDVDTSSPLHVGIDIGSKTVKLVMQDDAGDIAYASYDRHLSNVKETVLYVLRCAERYHPDGVFSVGVTGSAGMRLAEILDVPFTQEVVACRSALGRLLPDADVAIEIGGEDSKILFVTGGEELRMNSTCAGGTGGFIDTIAGMLDINAEKLNYYAHGCKTVYPIASRCAVFAQMDVRPLLNEGVSREDIAGSAIDAVVTQCITGLACGRAHSRQGRHARRPASFSVRFAKALRRPAGAGRRRRPRSRRGASVRRAGRGFRGGVGAASVHRRSARAHRGGIVG